jgi:hypothetical protein
MKIIKKPYINRGLFFDELDIFIITKIVECYKQNISLDTWVLAKNYVSCVFKLNLEKIYSLKKIECDDVYRKIKTKIKRYLEFGFIKKIINGGGEEIYELDMDKITVAKHKFSDGFFQCLIIRI